jgi:thioredoxin-related protein
MRSISVLAVIVLSVFMMSSGWKTNFEKAKEDARKENKLILLKFSGSDWCLPCIKMEKEVFAQESFSKYADKRLEMVNADFPRTKKYKPEKDIVKQNEALAEQYDKEGHFPFTVLLNADGKVLKTWDGYDGQKPEDMMQQIDLYANTNTQ